MTPRIAAVCAASLVLAAVVGCGPGAPAPKPAAPAPVADPDADPAAWKAMPADQRFNRAADRVARADCANVAGARTAYEFLAARGEDAAAADVLRKRLAVDPNCAWAHGVRGDIDVRPRVTECLKQCELADSDDAPPVVELKKLVGTAGPKWVDAALAKKVDELVAAVRADEARRDDPYQTAVDKWVKWQHGYRVMRDLPEIHAAVGRHLVFVSTGGDQAARTSGVAPGRAKAALERYKSLVERLEAAWDKDVAAPLKLATYEKQTADELTLLKVNVFTETGDFYSYQWDMDVWNVGADWAHYVDTEPRFLAALLGDSPNAVAYSGVSFLEEGVKQLVHFHTWDVSRKSRGRELDWAQCEARPLWSAEGFPRAFAHRVAVTSSRRWLPDVFVGDAAAKAKQWQPWTLREVLSIKDRAELKAAARRRVGSADTAGVDALSTLFLGRAASLADFLWNAEDGGKPKHRGRFVAYLGSEMNVKTRPDMNGREVGVRPGADEFRRAFGLASDADFDALEKEWNAYEAPLLERESQPWWLERLADTMKSLGVAKTKDK